MSSEPSFEAGDPLAVLRFDSSSSSDSSEDSDDIDDGYDAFF